VGSRRVGVTSWEHDRPPWSDHAKTTCSRSADACLAILGKLSSAAFGFGTRALRQGGLSAENGVPQHLAVVVEVDQVQESAPHDSGRSA
jgi:hypothetical protein